MMMNHVCSIHFLPLTGMSVIGHTRGAGPEKGNTVAGGTKPGAWRHLPLCWRVGVRGSLWFLSPDGHSVIPPLLIQCWTTACC